MQPDFILIGVILFCALGMLVSCRDSRRLLWHEYLTTEERDALYGVLSKVSDFGVTMEEAHNALQALASRGIQVHVEPVTIQTGATK